MARKNSKRKPVTPSQRFLIENKEEKKLKNNPYKPLTKGKHSKKGRNCYGRITSRRRGGGHKKLYRVIDFKRDKIDIPATVQTIEYDPNRSAMIALVAYQDGEKRYILAPEGIKVGDKIISSNKYFSEIEVGMNLPLKCIPDATKIHAVELIPGRGAQIARGAGTAVQLVATDEHHATIQLPSKEIRKVPVMCRATIGEIGNSKHGSRQLGKAGRNRWLGRRPRVRGVAMNPVDHPMGGGEGRTSGGGHPCSPWSQLSKGFPTRKRKCKSNKLIITRRNGKKIRRK